MKKIILLLIGLTVVNFANGQTLNFRGGTSISKMGWVVDSRPLLGYSIFAGIDYFDKPRFNLSSNIGMIRKGGKDKIQTRDSSTLFGPILIEKQTLDYLSINTTIDFKFPNRDIELLSSFISVGPRFDCLLSSSRHFDIFDLNRISIGLLFGIGLKYDISNFQLGLRADYYLDFTKVTDRTKVKTLAINLAVGYKLSKE